MKKFINFLIYPKVYFAIICYLLTILFSVPALIVAILGASGILSIVLFSLSGITFFYSVYTIVYFFPKIKKGTINLLKKSSFIKKILENYNYRTLLFAIFSLTLTCLYGIFNGVIFILFGVIGALILGVGMCMAMKVIFVNFSLSFVFGVIIGLIGILMVSVNYFIFLKILRKRKDKYKNYIYALSEKILNENN